jgi:hypothetical protein
MCKQIFKNIRNLFIFLIYNDKIPYSNLILVKQTQSWFHLKNGQNFPDIEQPTMDSLGGISGT